MEKQVFQFRHEAARRNAAQFCMTAPEGWFARFDAPKKSRDQEEKYHAMIGDIARQVDLLGERRDVEDAKRLLIDAFSRVMTAAGTPLRQRSRIVPSLDGSGFVQLGVQSRRFLVGEASEFIEYLYAFGTEHSVRWSEKSGVRERAMP
ncbi:recombination protein NinB [Pusillimonas noertemannii]|uniref:NinB protein n=1 Tax=Pusillimonas noertemannii TaxID=305977 RepID=A0A2U1CRX6_9BURK|nr:recombination protein NinB [Pusillimonas noertemannii]NYT67951.1 recombination protein NinB [Pusillimonas noertemannii]PVY68623.1 NinB protein [Pusillimonas noertemannii]TFL11908.1 hypothetical protein CSC72_01900 [Pusillimonas noertemannii]